MTQPILRPVAFALALAASVFGAVAAWAQASLGSPTFKVEAQRAALAADGTLNVTLVVTNTSKTSARAFVRANPDPSAADNRGHTWATNISYDVAGIYVCRGQSACLAGDLKQTEQAATLIGPDQKMQIQIKFTRSGLVVKGEPHGNSLAVVLLAYIQPVREEGSAFIGGAWRSQSFGVTNVPLRIVN